MGMMKPRIWVFLTIRVRSAARKCGTRQRLVYEGPTTSVGRSIGHSSPKLLRERIIALAGSGTGALQRELARLTAVGLVSVRRQGNQKHYQADAASPIFGELRGLVLKTFGLADMVRMALSPLAPQIRGAFVYGSVAKKLKIPLPVTSI